MQSIELKIPSNSATIVNFIVFDVALISLVYLLTEDVVGRMNDRTLRDGKPHRLYILCPPVLGGGLCSGILILEVKYSGKWRSEGRRHVLHDL